MDYIEKIYTKCRQDGHLKKFETFDSFKSGFVDEASIKKFYDFLIAKNYLVIDYSEFVRKFEESKNENVGSPQTQAEIEKKVGFFSKWKNEINKLKQAATKDLGIENKKKGIEIDSSIDNKYRITRNKDGSYNFGKNYCKAFKSLDWNKKSYYGELEEREKIKKLLSIDFKDTLCGFLFEGEFVAENIDIEYNQYYEEVGGVRSFEGVWKSGKFIGKFTTEQLEKKKIRYTKFEGEFHGDQFIGDTYNNSHFYKSSPTTFIEGIASTGSIKWKDSSFLGLPHFHTLTNSNPQSLHIMQIANEDTLYITDCNNHVFRIKLNANGTDCFTKKEGYGSQLAFYNYTTRAKSIKWSALRNDFENYYLRINEPFHINELVHISKIKSFSRKSPMNREREEDNIQLYGETITFSNFPIFNIGSEICFDCFSDEDRTALFIVHDSLYTGTFFSELKIVNTLLNAGYVNGYGKYSPLKKLFGDTIGGDFDYKNTKVEKIFSFLLNVNLLISNARGKENRDLLLEKFKNLLFTNTDHLDLVSPDSTLMAEIDFSKDDRLGIEIKVNFNFPSQQDLKDFRKYKNDVEEGKFYFMLMQTQRLIQNEELFGYHNRLELKSLFAEQGNAEPPASEKAQNCLDYLSHIKRYLIDTVHPKDDAEKLITIIKLIITDNY